ncbi:MAG: glycosyltransferase family 2 protein [Acidobacteriota bacterium]|nr:glycosyltransferase family 2 protein [Acidobacteriota bacterium]
MSVRFSILMPVYNREKYLRQAIDSVLSQTFTDYELIAIDDGSTDASPQILESYGSRIKYIQQRNQGPEVARNRGAALAQGEYVVFLDSDDLFFPFALATFDRVIRKFDSPPLVLGSMLFFEKDEQIPSEAFIPRPAEVYKFRDYISKTRPLGTNCIIVSKSAFDEVGGCRNTTPDTFYGDDTHLLLRLGTFSPCVVIEKPATSGYRQHSANSSKSTEAISEALISLAQKERQGGFPGGTSRRLDRYALIGGRAAAWAYNYCWRAGRRKLGLHLIFGTAPMAFAAIWKKAVQHFRKPASPILVPEN